MLNFSDEGLRVVRGRKIKTFVSVVGAVVGAITCVASSVQLN
jgi:hypothetical protein